MGSVLGLDRFFGSTASGRRGGVDVKVSQGEKVESTAESEVVVASASNTEPRNGSVKRRVAESVTQSTEDAQQARPNGPATIPDVSARPAKAKSWRQSLPALLLQVSLFQTTAGPIGFMALRHISYPTMVLGKVCHMTLSILQNVTRRRVSCSSDYAPCCDDCECML